MTKAIKHLGVTLALVVLAAEAARGAEPSKSTFSLYGFVLPTWEVAGGAIDSFGQPNLSAYTAAGNPALQGSPEQARSSFQVAQSRLGFLVRPNENTLGRMELDFIDFTKASPTTASQPRVRRAAIDYLASENVTLRFGQDWDLVSPLAPHSFNFVGHYFESGDIGFMRIQAQAIIKDGNWEHGVAIGMPGNNNNNADSTLELAGLPTLAIRETLSVGKSDKIGVSALAASLRKATHSSDRLFAGTATAFYESHPSESWEVRTEAYLGQNTQNLGMLGLAFGNAQSPSVKEAGAYVTSRWKASDRFAFFAGAGGAWILNSESLLLGYSLTAPTLTGIALTNTGPGLSRNLTVRAGMEWMPAEAITFFAEAAELFSRHRLLPATAAYFSGDRSATVVQVGSMLTF